MHFDEHFDVHSVVHFAEGHGTQDYRGRVGWLGSHFGGIQKNGRSEESFPSRQEMWWLGLHQSIEEQRQC